MDSTFKIDIKSKILSIKGQINDSRTSFIFPSLHKVEISPFGYLVYWRLVSKNKNQNNSHWYFVLDKQEFKTGIETIVQHLNSLILENY